MLSDSFGFRVKRGVLYESLWLWLGFFLCPTLVNSYGGLEFRMKPKWRQLWNIDSRFQLGTLNVLCRYFGPLLKNFLGFDNPRTFLHQQTRCNVSTSLHYTGVSFFCPQKSRLLIAYFYSVAAPGHTKRVCQCSSWIIGVVFRYPRLPKTVRGVTHSLLNCKWWKLFFPQELANINNKVLLSTSSFLSLRKHIRLTLFFQKGNNKLLNFSY